MLSERVIAYLLQNDADLADVVNDRIYNTIPVQDAADPFVIFHLVNSEKTWTLDGPTFPYRSEFQIHYFADNYTTLASVAKRIRAALDGQSGLEAVPKAR